MKSKNQNTATVGNRIKHYRKKMNLTQAQLAEKLGITSSAVANYEGGYGTPRQDILVKMADIFDVSLDVLCRGIPNIKDPLSAQLGYGYYDNLIPFYASNNLVGIRTADWSLADSIMKLPTVKKFDVGKLFSTEVCDNSMINAGLPASTYIIINPDRNLVTNNTVAVIDNINKELIVRTISKDGPVIHLTTDGYGNNTTITTYVGDDNYTIIGTVVASLSRLKIIDN